MNSTNSIEEFNVINRHNEVIPLDFNRILNRLTSLKNMEPKLHVNVGLIAQNTIKLMINNITTRELDNISANICASMITVHPDYGTLASRIEISNLHKETNDNYYQMLLELNDYKNENNEPIQLVDNKLIMFAKYYSDLIQEKVNYNLDFNFTYFGIKTLKKSYLLKHNLSDNKVKILERPQHLYLRVAIGIYFNKIDDNGKTDEYTLEDIFNTYKLLSEHYYTHATPTLFNGGTPRQSLSSCFLLEIGDNLEGIYKTLSDTAKISKWSGGIGVHCSQVRAKNSLIKSTNGRSEGIIPMLKVYNDSALYVSQGGGKRKGSTAVYLETWHADVFDFLDLKKPIGDEYLRARDLFLAMWIPDLFMKRLIQAIETKQVVLWSLFCPNIAKGLADKYGNEFEELYLKYENEKKYNKQVDITILWKKILEIQMESGNPYLMFKDQVNRKGNQNNMGTIKSSNLCVHGDTLILTKDGYYPIKDLANKEVEIWNGSEFSLSPVRKTNVNQELLKIITDDGCELKCTPYHKFYIVSGSRNTKHIIKEAHELKPNDRLIKCNFPVLDGNKEFDFKYPYTHGFYSGDGTNYKNNDGSRKIPVIDLYHEKQNLLEYLDYNRTNQFSKKQNKLRIILHSDINQKFEVPINATLDNKLLWLAGFIDSDGTICKNQDARCIQITSIHKDFLYKVKLLCNTLGLNPKLTKNTQGGLKLMPDNKGSGELKLYNCKNSYRLLFNVLDTYKLYNELNIPTKRVLNDINTPPQRDARKFVRISSIEKVENLHDTYCFNESKEHKGIFNGIITSQCAEINIYTDKDNIGVCNLASISLPKFVETTKNGVVFYNYQKLYEITKIIIKNLNQVIDNNIYPVPEGKYSDSRNRPLGLGVQGLADVFFKFKIPFTSNKAKEMNKLIFETIYFASVESSCELAQKYGPYETYSTSMVANGKLQFDLWGVTPSNMWNWDKLRMNISKYGLYNSLLTALMPTASTSQIMGNYEMFEPITSNMFTRNTLSGTFQIINKYLITDLLELNIWNDTLKQKIIANNGSIQNIDEIPENIKEIYKTVWELKQKDLIDMDADRSSYVCQSSSSNRYMSNPNNNKLTSMYIYCWKKGLKTGCYYLRSQSGADAVKFNVDVNILKEQKLKKKLELINKYNQSLEEECTVCSA
jgi:ribonucleoside-diphosphate reductase alpha chain